MTAWALGGTRNFVACYPDASVLTPFNPFAEIAGEWLLLVNGELNSVHH
jgi:hypothetical protein